MFITCETYRQAAYAPDQNFTGVGSTITTGATTSQTTNVNGAHFGFTATSIRISNATNATLQTVQVAAGVPDGAVSTGAVGIYATSVNSSTFPAQAQTTVTFRNTTNTTQSVSFTVSFFSTILETLSTFFTSVTGSGQDLSLKTTFTNVTSSTFRTLSSQDGSALFSFVSGAPNSGTYTASITMTSSTASLSGSTTSTTSNTANVGTLLTSISSIVTATISSLQAFSSTATATSTRSIWTVIAGIVTTISSAVTTTVGMITNGSFSRATTVTTTTVTPRWWGWSSERGTLLLATGNGGADLPAWLEQSNWTAAGAGLWDFNFSTQTTLWPVQPVGTVAAIATANTTAINTTSSFSLIWSSIFTVFGTSTYTTTTTATAPGAFTDKSDPFYTTAELPFLTVAQTVTTYTQFSATVTGFVLHNLNTTTSTTSSAFDADIVTLILTSKSFASSRGTFLSQVTVTTLGPGYTTASAQTGDGVTALLSTYLLSFPQLGIGTTTMNVTWFYDTSCPTVLSRLGSSSSGSATTTATSTTNLPPGLFSATSSSSTLTGYTENFTQNVFASPYLAYAPNSSLTSVAGGGIAVYAQPAVTWWQAQPLMQGFAPMSASTGQTFQNILSPQTIVAGFMPYQSGTHLAFGSNGAPVTSTAWGLWAFLAVPLTTKTGTGAATVTSFTFADIASNASLTLAQTLAFPNPPVESLATIFFNSTVTTSTTQATTTASTSTTSSASGSNTNGFTLGGSITSTFAQSRGYSFTSSVNQTVSSVGIVSYFIGTTLTATYNYITTTLLPVTLTLSTSWNAANTNGVPTAILAPGVGGYPQITNQAATIYAIGAAVSLFAGTSFTWSAAFENFGQIVVVGSATTTSSTTSAAGAGSYPVYTIPGQVSMLTSPASFAGTAPNRFVPPVTTATNFWATPSPFLTPNGVLNQ